MVIDLIIDISSGVLVVGIVSLVFILFLSYTLLYTYDTPV